MCVRGFAVDKAILTEEILTVVNNDGYVFKDHLMMMMMMMMMMMITADGNV
jgi:hypothetical protein